MPTLVIKGLTSALHKKLKEKAKEARRSMTQEAIHLLESGLSGNALAHSSVLWEPPVPYKGLKPVPLKTLNRWKRDGLV